MVWETELGNGGAWVINPFFRGDIFVGDLFNPSWHLAGFFSPEFNALRRVPQWKKLAEATAGLDTNLCLPSKLCAYTIEPFCAQDSTSALFADQTACVSIKRGFGGMIRLGNNLHNLFDITALQIGFFYNFFIKARDCIKVKCIKSQPESPFEETGQINKLLTTRYEINALNESHRSYAHALEWRLSYQANEYVGLSIGSLHTITGENTPQVNQIFGKLAFYF